MSIEHSKQDESGTDLLHAIHALYTEHISFTPNLDPAWRDLPYEGVEGNPHHAEKLILNRMKNSNRNAVIYVLSCMREVDFSLELRQYRLHCSRYQKGVEQDAVEPNLLNFVMNKSNALSKRIYFARNILPSIKPELEHIYNGG